jgi:glycosyltransferase involved in cell wall biosynthesis
VNVHEPSGALVSLLKGNSKVVVTSHGVEQRGWQISLEDEKLGRGRPWGRSKYIHPATSLWQSRLAFRHSNHVFCLNEEDRRFLNARFGIPQTKTTRIFPAAGEAYSLIRNRDYSCFRRILFAGTWLVRKGRQDAVEAFSALAGKYPQLEFATLGAGAPLEAIQAAFPSDLRDRVKIFNPANDSDGAKVMAESDVFLLPSVFEGTPLTLMEAMHNGLPIITTNVCGMRDVIRDGENGLLVPVRSSESIVAAIERLATDPALRQKIGAAAREEGLNRYTWAQSAKPVWDVYQGL